MAFISVSNTFSDGTVSSAPQVNTNFNDIVNGLASTTYDLSMANVYGTTVSAVSGLFARVSCVSGYFGQVSAPSANLTTINNTVISSATGLFERVSCISGFFNQVSASTGIFSYINMGTTTNLSYYGDGSFTATITGMTTSITTSFVYTKIGKFVNICYDGLITGTSSGTTMSITGIPVALGTGYRGNAATIVYDNLPSVGLAYIAGQTIKFRKADASESFTTGVTKGFYYLSLNYTLA